MSPTRRELLLATSAGLLLRTLSRTFAQEKGKPKKILFFTKSSGFQHSVIARKGDELSLAERILTELGEEHGFEVVASKDTSPLRSRSGGSSILPTANRKKRSSRKRPA